jgi:hypothetical protein
MSYREEYSFFLRGYSGVFISTSIRAQQMRVGFNYSNAYAYPWPNPLAHKYGQNLTRLSRPFLITDRSEGDRDLGAQDGKHDGSPTVDENHIHPEVCFLPH